MSFARDIERFAKKTGQSLDAVVHSITFEWFASVILMSPVGDASKWKTKYPPVGYVGGRFRGNWQVTIDGPASSVVQGIRSQQETIGAMTAAIPLKAGKETYMSNLLPYAMRLEYDGWSDQAPTGMVRVSMTRIKGIVRKAVQEHKV